MKTAGALSCAAIALGSCNQSAIDPSQSLVGAKQLPSAKVLSRETIYISRDTESPRGRLSYELQPDNSLFVMFEAYESGTDKGDTQQTLKVNPEIAASARRNLWRLRPDKLRGIKFTTFPAGCPKLPDNVPADFDISFNVGSSTMDLDPAKAEAVIIPVKDYCHSAENVEARAVIESVIRSFPKSKVAAQYGEGKVFVVVPSQASDPWQP